VRHARDGPDARRRGGRTNPSARSARMSGWTEKAPQRRRRWRRSRRSGWRAISTADAIATRRARGTLSCATSPRRSAAPMRARPPTKALLAALGGCTGPT
jgi:hypothetical protein